METLIPQHTSCLTQGLGIGAGKGGTKLKNWAPIILGDQICAGGHLKVLQGSIKNDYN